MKQEENLFRMGKLILKGFSTVTAMTAISTRKNATVLEYVWLTGRCDMKWSETVKMARDRYAFNVMEGSPKSRCGIDMDARRFFREMRR